MTTILEMAADIHRATGQDPLTPRWGATLREFYGLPLREQDTELLAASTRIGKAEWMARATAASTNRRQRRELWARVGRRGRKSFTMALVGLYEACFGGHERYLVNGEQGLIAVISKDAAGSTIVARFLELHARALGIETKWSSIGSVRVLELVGFAFAVAVFPCSARAPRGWAVPIVIVDEPAHWPVDDDYANSDEAVLGAIRPAMAQFPNSKLVAISSPLGCAGLHYDTIEANLGPNGDPDILAVQGPTWEWNPDITEARTREIEKNPKWHASEFGAVPRVGGDTVFPVDLIDAAFSRYARYVAAKPPKSYLVLDPSSGGATSADWFTWCTAGWVNNEHERWYRDENGKPERNAWGERMECGGYVPAPPVLKLSELDAVQGGFFGQVSGDSIIRRIARAANRFDTRLCYSDQREQFFLESALHKENLRLRVFPWTASSKPQAVEIVRRWFADGLIALPPDSLHSARLRSELLGFEEKITASGQLSYGARRGGHDDFVALLITLAHAELEAELKHSPIAPQRTYGLLQTSPGGAGG